MTEHLWDEFVIYVNCYSAVAETVDTTRRAWVRPAFGLEEFVRDANPFVFDERGSFEEAVFDSFHDMFADRFEKGVCSSEDGHALCREWLASLEGDAYGTDLVRAFLQCATDAAFRDACPAIERQLAMRSVRIERNPQEEPHPYVEEIPTHNVTDSDVEAVIRLLAKGDEAFADLLRKRLADEDA